MQASNGVDWHRVHATLEASNRALQAALAPGQHEIDRALQLRAVQLAARREKQRAVVQEELMLVAWVEAEQVGFRARDIRRVCIAPPISALPGAQRAVQGIAAFAGELVTVVALRAVVGLECDECSRPQRLILLRHLPLGVLVDGLKGTESFSEPDLQPMNADATAIAGVVDCVTRSGVGVVNCRKLFAHPAVGDGTDTAATESAAALVHETPTRLGREVRS